MNTKTTYCENRLLCICCSEWTIERNALAKYQNKRKKNKNNGRPLSLNPSLRSTIMIMLSIHCWMFIQMNLFAKLYLYLKNSKYSQGHDLDIFVWFYHLQLVASRMDTLLCIEISFSLFPCIQRRKTEKVLFLSFSFFFYFKFASLRCTLYWFYFSLFRLFSVVIFANYYEINNSTCSFSYIFAKNFSI